jgi:hypothetical protein
MFSHFRWNLIFRYHPDRNKNDESGEAEVCFLCSIQRLVLDSNELFEHWQLFKARFEHRLFASVSRWAVVFLKRVLGKEKYYYVCTLLIYIEKKGSFCVSLDTFSR